MYKTPCFTASKVFILGCGTKAAREALADWHWSTTCAEFEVCGPIVTLKTFSLSSWLVAASVSTGSETLSLSRSSSISSSSSGLTLSCSPFPMSAFLFLLFFRSRSLFLPLETTIFVSHFVNRRLFSVNQNNADLHTEQCIFESTLRATICLMTKNYQHRKTRGMMSKYQT